SDKFIKLWSIIPLLTAVMFSTAAFAQGDDFPGVPLPNPGFPVGGSPGFPFPPSPDGSNGWRTKGPVQRLWNVHKGDKLIIGQDRWHCQGCYWGFSTATIMPAVSGVTDLDLYYPNGVSSTSQWGHGGAGNWCMYCYWKFTAQDDFPEVALVYYGPGSFWAVAELLDVWPAPPPPPPLFQVLTDPDKETAGNISTFLSGASADWIISTTSNLVVPPVSYIFAGLGYGGNRLAGRFAQIAADPWNGNYCSPADLTLDAQMISDLDWITPYDSTGGWMNASLVMSEAYGHLAVDSADRAMSASQVGAWDCAGARKGEALNALHAMGDWTAVLQWTIANNSYMNGGLSGLDYYVGSIGDIAAWLQRVQ